MYNNISSGWSRIKECRIEFVLWFLAKTLIFISLWEMQKALDSLLPNTKTQALPNQVSLQIISNNSLIIAVAMLVWDNVTLSFCDGSWQSGLKIPVLPYFEGVKRI